MTTTTTSLTPLVGVVVTGMSGRDMIDPKVADECQRLLDHHSLVVYREVHIEDDDLIEFSKLLGTIAVVPTGEHERPEIQTITLDPGKTNSTLASYRHGNFHWHIDGATQLTPQKGTLLSAKEIDDSGQGGTEFASTYAAYEGLPQDEKDRIADLEVEHSFAAAQRRVDPDPSEVERARWDRVPTRVHPLVSNHRDGRRSMLLGATAGRVVGWTEAESDALLEQLLAWATQPQYVVHHTWRRGDLVTWDNTGMLHRAMPFEPTSPRLMHRITLVGDEAVA